MHIYNQEDMSTQQWRFQRERGEYHELYIKIFFDEFGFTYDDNDLDWEWHLPSLAITVVCPDGRARRMRASRTSAYDPFVKGVIRMSSIGVSGTAYPYLDGTKRWYFIPALRGRNSDMIRWWGEDPREWESDPSKGSFGRGKEEFELYVGPMMSEEERKAAAAVSHRRP